MCFCCSIFGVKAQNDTQILSNDSIKTDIEIPTVKLDSMTMAYIDAIYSTMKKNTPRYKMYATQNINILLKLDTATGKVWMVQYSIGKNDRLTVPVDDDSLLFDWETIQAGRFELYPTQNMYNFILLDTQKGYTYQVQWNTDADKCFRINIY